MFSNPHQSLELTAPVLSLNPEQRSSLIQRIAQRSSGLIGQEWCTHTIKGDPTRMERHPELAATQFFKHVQDMPYIVRLRIEPSSGNAMTAVALSTTTFHGLTAAIFFSFDSSLELAHFVEWLGEVREQDEFAPSLVSNEFLASDVSRFLNQESAADLVISEVAETATRSTNLDLEELVVPPDELFQRRLRDADIS